MNKKNKYKSQNNIEKKIIISVIVLIIILSSALILLNNMKEESEESSINVSEVFETVKDVLDYYECTYINESRSSDKNYDIDINLIFKYLLYEDDKSHEDFYNKVIKAIAEVLNYQNFIMIDKENDIKIEVVCEGKKISKIIINGMEDYFIYMDSQISLKKYKEIKETEIVIDSNELINVINNKWMGNIDFGTRESIFKSYYIYFDEGIETRKIDSKIYNIVFTKKYANTVVNGLEVGADFDLIERKLGQASFKDDDGEIIGYKCKDIYIFFSKDQISVYRRESYDYTEFLGLVDKFLNDEKDLMEFMNDLTYLWPDYSEYTYDSTYFFLSYPLKGIDIKLNHENVSGIIVYNNFGVTQKTISEYLENTEFISKLQVDNVYEAELRRYKEKNSLLTTCKNFVNELETQENVNESNTFSYYMDLDDNGFIVTTYFVSKDDQYANSELSESIYTYTWMGNNYFIYSIKNKGIFYYDVVNRTKGNLVLGGEEYNITGFQDGTLTYDNTQMQIEY